MRDFEIDLKGLYSADEVQDLMREVLPLPDYYGGTLDALFDVLTEQSEGWRLHISGMVEAEAVMGKYIRSLRKMCLRAASESDFVEVEFSD